MFIDRSTPVCRFVVRSIKIDCCWSLLISTLSFSILRRSFSFSASNSNDRSKHPVNFISKKCRQKKERTLKLPLNWTQKTKRIKSVVFLYVSMEKNFFLFLQEKTRRRTNTTSDGRWTEERRRETWENSSNSIHSSNLFLFRTRKMVDLERNPKQKNYKKKRLE